jgi:hypothetical protein
VILPRLFKSARLSRTQLYTSQTTGVVLFLPLECPEGISQPDTTERHALCLVYGVSVSPLDEG